MNIQPHPRPAWCWKSTSYQMVNRVLIITPPKILLPMRIGNRTATMERTIEAGIEEQIEALRQEYGISARRVSRRAVVHGAPRQVPRVALRGEW